MSNETLKTTDIENKLQQVAKAFRIAGTYKSYEQIKMGNVNQTYKVTYVRDDGKLKMYIIQRINTYAFHNPDQLMSNIDKVTRYIHEQSPDETALHYHHMNDGKNYLIDDGVWRLCNYVQSVTYNECTTLEVLRNAGTAFGEFQTKLGDFDASQLYETIPDFHDTRKRLETLFNTVHEDPCGRVQEASDDIAYIASVMNKACTLTDMLKRGELPLRVTHNDTKINNVLFDETTDKALVIVDLDTVMPGLVGSDFGDAVRFACNFVAEDSKEADKAGLNMTMFRAFAEGFLAQTKATLSEAEINTLALSCFAITIELASRFLEDYLRGDKYFNIAYPGHNLVRTRCQLALAKDIEKKLTEMDEIVKECVR